MKALILAGGEGTRLRPITHTSAKQLVPVANKPILYYGIEAMVGAGITEIGVITGSTGSEVRKALGDGSAFGASITYIPQDAPLGLAHCVLIAREFLGDDDFVMYLGDNLLEQDLAAFVSAFETARASSEPPSAQILLKHVPDPHRFGIATLDAAGHVVELVEKPADPPSDLALVGVYLFDPEIHEAVRAIEPSARGELEITDAIQWLISNGRRVRTELLTGWWIDTGKLTPLLEANRLLLERIETTIEGTVDDLSSIDGRVVVAEGAVVVNSTIRGPVAIGAGARIVDSFVGPFSAIGENCEVVNSEIEHSVVMSGSRILQIPRLEDSLIGRDAVIERTARRPRAAPDDRRPLPGRRRMSPQIVDFDARATAIDGLLIVTMKQVTDERGTVRELFRRSAFEEAGVTGLGRFDQINVTATGRGGLRGLHAEAMTKLVTVVYGEAFGAYVDLRADSATHGVVVTVTLVPGTQVLVPEGVGNGFQAVVDGTQYAYCFTDEWRPGMAGTACNPLDRSLGIDWPLPVDPDDRTQISAKDLAAPLFADLAGAAK